MIIEIIDFLQMYYEVVCIHSLLQFSFIRYNSLSQVPPLLSGAHFSAITVNSHFTPG